MKSYFLASNFCINFFGRKNSQIPTYIFNLLKFFSFLILVFSLFVSYDDFPFNLLLIYFVQVYVLSKYRVLHVGCILT